MHSAWIKSIRFADAVRGREEERGRKGDGEEEKGEGEREREREAGHVCKSNSLSSLILILNFKTLLISSIYKSTTNKL